MKRIICKDYAEMSETAAKLVAGQIKAKPSTILGLATGSTPVGMYKRLIEYNKSGELDFSHVTTFNLDEYYPISRENDQSYYYFMMQNLFSHINIKPGNINIPNGETAVPEAECAAYDEKICAMGGIDLQILGIGQNGHIGFNEPDDTLCAETHVTSLTQSTIQANSIYFPNVDSMPKKALTMGLFAILNAKKVIILINGIKKAEATKRMLTGKIGTDCPASFLQLHDDVTVIMDKEAASLI
jgi:glucosamine-6-phosphate deaminase